MYNDKEILGVLKDYTPKGDIRGFPMEVLYFMLKYQKEQYAGIFFDNFEVMRDHTCGFAWSRTIEGDTFWSSVISDKNFKTFYDRYPQRINFKKSLPLWIY